MRIIVPEPAIVRQEPPAEDHLTLERRRVLRDRRKNRRDRRGGVREGVIVTLSTKTDRRQGGDRRRQTP
jgi:hypothetical protein